MALSIFNKVRYGQCYLVLTAYSSLMKGNKTKTNPSLPVDVKFSDGKQSFCFVNVIIKEKRKNKFKASVLYDPRL